jgi:hypothetical protein
MTTLLSTAYWPNLHYFYYVLHSEKVCIEAYEYYQKQSYRNRCEILTANGPLKLSIPVKHLAHKEFTKDIEISYNENWQIKHWRAIVSAYKNSPYFEHFEDEVKTIYSKQVKFLLDYNTQQLDLLFKIMRIKKDIYLSSNYAETSFELIDQREHIHPKLDVGTDKVVAEVLQKPYYQTFEAKMAFVPNRSTLDLLFNTGLDSLDYLGFKRS